MERIPRTNILSKSTKDTFGRFSESVLRNGMVIGEEENPDDMIGRILREFMRIEREVFAYGSS